jgi:very-short-patch-repair endonuclease
MLDNLCSYGCGKPAILQFKNGKYCCSDSKNKCSALREKNSKGINKNGVWNKGLTKETDKRVLKYANSGKMTKIEQVKNGEYVIWNKGLTQNTDIRVYNNVKNLSNNRKGYYHTLDYFVDKYGSEIGEDKYNKLNQKKRLIIENFIIKYGEEDGFNRYEKYINEKKPYFSKISQELFFSIDKGDAYFASKNKEFGLRDKNNYYFYDFVDVKRKKVIEFNGDDFHANPNIYESEEIPLKFINKTASEIWNFDKNKLNKIIDKGYQVLIIWESDYKKNKNKVIDDCIKFLSSTTL